MINTLHTRVECWDIFEISLDGPSTGNPFIEVNLKALFRLGNRIVEVAGFYDGEGIYKIRFMPDTLGTWNFITQSNCKELDGINGTFQCIEPSQNNHGPVKVVNTYYFSYADGTPFIPFGTTCYSWNHRKENMKQSTIDTLRKSPFNKVRMLILPQNHGNYNQDIEFFPFEGSPENGWDFTRINPRFFRNLESCVKELMKLGIEADLIFFHPYDVWGFSNMPRETDDFYIRYAISRLAAFRNVWWSVANEYDLIKSKDMNDWDRICKIISENDPYFHLCSIHNSGPFYDHRKPWISHLSVQCQSYDKWNRLTESIPEWREQYKKPVIIDECGYEGNEYRFWGSIPPQEFVRRVWHGTVMGGYVGHGETYMNDENLVWTGQGVALKGQSPERIAFLKKILEEAPVKFLKPLNIGKHIDCAGKEKEYYLAYLGINQPAYVQLQLPEGIDFKIDLLDTWEMAIKPAEGIYSGNCRLYLPAKPYMAFRIYRA